MSKCGDGVDDDEFDCIAIDEDDDDELFEAVDDETGGGDGVLAASF